MRRGWFRGRTWNAVPMCRRRVRGDGAGHLKRRGDHRARRREVDLAEPEAVDAPGLRSVGQLEDVPERRGLGGLLALLLGRTFRSARVCLPGALGLHRGAPPHRRGRKTPGRASWPKAASTSRATASPTSTILCQSRAPSSQNATRCASILTRRAAAVKKRRGRSPLDASAEAGVRLSLWAVALSCLPLPAAAVPGPRALDGELRGGQLLYELPPRGV
jgi:hypothetical protein